MRQYFSMTQRPTKFRKTHIRDWRIHRGLTLELLASRVAELTGGSMTAGNLSNLERGIQGYTQETLEAIANALDTDAGSLIMRNPRDGEAIWSIWDNAQPGERRQIEDVAKALTQRRGAAG